jgi:pyroglutamyl-peptidase
VKSNILLTGFGPFPGVATNASGLLVPRLARAARRRFPQAVVSTAILPTEWVRGPVKARAAFVRAKPDVVVHFGVSDRAHGFVIERRGVNGCVRSPDGAGLMPVLPVLDEAGPKRRAASLPVAGIVARLRALGLPAVPSDDAGQYLCNAVLYQSLGMAEATGAGMAGFVHLPASLAAHGGAQVLTMEQALAGSLEILAVCLEEAALVS